MQSKGLGTGYLCSQNDQLYISYMANDSCVHICKVEWWGEVGISCSNYILGMKSATEEVIIISEFWSCKEPQRLFRGKESN